MKTKRFYQSVPSQKKRVTYLDLCKGFGYITTMFVIAVGGVLLIAVLAQSCEFLSNLFK